MWQQNRVMEFFCCAFKASGIKSSRTQQGERHSLFGEGEGERESHLVRLQRELWLRGLNQSG